MPRGCCVTVAGITPACAGKSDPEKQPGAARWDHPRVCGEKCTACGVSPITVGSPPRVRGKDGVYVLGCSGHGITPACAGKSLTWDRVAKDMKDHPRVCGEKFVRCPYPQRYRGSPPRVRGKAEVFDSPDLLEGITPACAGKSIIAQRRHAAIQDHPRVCGEKPSLFLMGCIELGSPPRVRGKDGVALGGCGAVGITPACAGKSFFKRFMRLFCGDHPRVCGEKYHSRAWKDAVSGSPPRVRGKVVTLHGLELGAGITPACAGKSCCTQCADLRTRDHPRVCGEKRGTSMNAATKTGSPPRVRGKGPEAVMRRAVLRITPACAGKSRSPRSASALRWDHPRVCGEKRRSASSGAETRGITPACAGKSQPQHIQPNGGGDHPRVCGEKSAWRM